MFAATRTPARKQTERRKLYDATPRNSPPEARTSFDEWVSGRGSPLLPQSPPTKPAAIAAPSAPHPVAASSGRAKTPEAAPPREQEPRRQSIGMTIKSPQTKPLGRVAEARAHLNNAKLHLNNSRNIKTEIKEEVQKAVDRLFQLVKESEAELGGKRKGQEKVQSGENKNTEGENKREGKDLERIIERHITMLKENNEYMEELKKTMEKQARSSSGASAKADNVLAEVQELRRVTEETGKRISSLQESLPMPGTLKTYASAAAANPRKQLPEQTALLSVVVTAKNELETAEEVLSRIRKAVNAKEGGVRVERIRKAKDRKVIVGCRTEEERRKVRDRISKEGELNVEDIQNKDPLVILRDVLQSNSDEDVLKALRNQNRNIFKDLGKEQDRLEIAYKKRTRNPHTSHIVMRVSPKLWQRMVEAEAVHIDLQRVKVGDQSPLVQCSLCLGYGHGRRFCKETLEKCSHCGGPHMKSQCADWLAGAAPSCCNCMHAKIDRVDHNAFSSECSVRRKWDALARAAVAYC